MVKFSIFKPGFKYHKHITLEQVAEVHKSDETHIKTDSIIHEFKSGLEAHWKGIDKKPYQKLKRMTLRSFCPSVIGHYQDGKNEYNGITHFDIDDEKLTKSEKDKIRKWLEAQPFTLMVGNSVSNEVTGDLFALIKGENSDFIEDYLNNKCTIYKEFKASPVASIRYIAYDANIYLSIDSTPIDGVSQMFEIDHKKNKVKLIRPLGQKHISARALLVKINTVKQRLLNSNKLSTYIDDRETWLNKICFPLGLAAYENPEIADEIEEVFIGLSSKSDKWDNDTKWWYSQCVKKPKVKDPSTINTFLTIDREIPYVEADILIDTGAIYQDIRHELPMIIVNICDLFGKPHEQDLALITSITLFSQLMTECGFSYNLSISRTQIYSYIIAQAGEGKSAAKVVKRIFREVDMLLAESMYKTHAEAETYYLLSTSARKEWQDDGRPIPKMVRSGLFFPMDTTAADMIDMLNDTGGLGCIFTTEGDILSKFKGSENSISALLRTGYEGEEYSQGRIGSTKEGKLSVRIPEVNLSVLITSTTGQIEKIIDNAEDGLFSRFLFSSIPEDMDFRDLTNITPLDTSNLEAEVVSIYEKLNYKQEKSIIGIHDKGRKVRTLFKPLEDQPGILVTEFDRLKKEYINVVSKAMAGTINRAGERVYRIGIILSALKILESRELDSIEEIDSDSFNAALKICNKGIEQSSSVLKVFSNGVPESGNERSEKSKDKYMARYNTCDEFRPDTPWAEIATIIRNDEKDVTVKEATLRKWWNDDKTQAKYKK